MRIALITLAILSCGPTVNRWGPLVRRPDTSELTWVIMDTTVMNPVMDSLKVALPNERAMCLVGHVETRPIDDAGGIRITGAYAAQEDSATPSRVVFASADAGCHLHDGLTIGFLHDHPDANDICTHSDDDANLLFGAPGFAMAVVICADGYGEVLWQDGRRDSFKWMAN